MEADAALRSNLEKAKADTKLKIAMARELGSFLTELVDGGHNPTATLAYRAGFLAGHLYAHGTPVTPAEDEDDDEEDTGHANAPTPPSGALSMGIG